MTNSEFMKILDDDSLELTAEELENIIEEELQKDESEMDPDLIEYCLHYINKAESKGSGGKKTEPAEDKPKKPHSGRLKKILIIAATIALLLITSGIATIATDKNVKNSAITFYENRIRVHFDKPKEESGIPGTEIAAELKKHDISDLKLPAMFFSSDCIYSNILEDNTENLKAISLSYQTKNSSGQVSVSRFYSEEIIPLVDFHNTTSYSQAEEFMVNGLKVFVIEQGDFCSIAYQDNLIQYMMYLNTNFASAIEIAKTISDTES